MPDTSNITILAVDDNDAIRYSLARALQGGGYRVLEARNGTETLRLADEGPDLITLDVHLPDIDGFEVCRRLKANPKTAHIPVLHISATVTDTDNRVRGLETADGYLTEPISREELLATVASLLRLKQAERDARLQAREAETARRELKEAHNELELRVQERTDQVRQLSVQLMKLQDDERRRIARELHDSTGQMLAAMKMVLDQMKAEAKSENLAVLVSQTIDINEEMSRQLRTMSYLLHPPLLDEVGLPSAVKWYAEGFAERSAIKVALQIDPDFGRLPGEVEIALFRVVQECLTNIHRHSGGSSASIRLSRNPERISIEISDSGKGIPLGRLREGKVVMGVGMMGIQERMRQFGGSVEVTSSEDGTAVVAAIPLSNWLREAV
ncbi:MAG: response regulator [Terriglobales bacterium]|jgi:signal transduction histidine kinase